MDACISSLSAIVDSDCSDDTTIILDLFISRKKLPSPIICCCEGTSTFHAEFLSVYRTFKNSYLELVQLFFPGLHKSNTNVKKCVNGNDTSFVTSLHAFSVSPFLKYPPVCYIKPHVFPLLLQKYILTFF